MGKILDRVQLVEMKLKTLSKDKIDRLRKNTEELSAEEHFQYMNWQAELFASGMISQDDAMFLYSRLADWDRAKLAEKIVIITVMAEFAEIKTKSMRGAKRAVKRKITKKKIK